MSKRVTRETLAVLHQLYYTPGMEKFAFFLFGVTGNLAQIKIIPSIYDLFEKKLIAPDTKIVGVARRDIELAAFRDFIWQSLQQKTGPHAHPIREDVWKIMSNNLSYIQGEFSDTSLYARIAAYVEEHAIPNKIYYLATYPQLYQTIFELLQKQKLNKEKNGWTRLMIEKPIGTDLPSARKLNTLLSRFFKETQIYRLDHYLGKETLQNILTFRFGNAILEPLFSRDTVDHVQITAAENFGIGRRGTYYDSMGALKDVGQNHILQMLTLVTMDAPTRFDNASVTRERVKVLERLIPDPNGIVFGQYDGYTGEEFVQRDSQTDTFFALKTSIDTYRWKDVPIYIRAGKRLSETVTQIHVVFKPSDSRLFKHLGFGMEPNILTFRIQPKEAIIFQFLSKKVGHALELEPQRMQFDYPVGKNQMPDAYERLIADAIEGDQTFFNDAIEVEEQWEFTDALSSVRKRPVSYSQGSWGPNEAMQLIEKDGRSWII